MTTNVPPGAEALLNFIGKAETGTSGRDAYDVLVFHQQGKLPKPLTDYTLDELVAAQKVWGSTGWTIKGKRLRGSAAGKYQIIRKTLIGLIDHLSLSGDTKFSPEVQDELGFALLTMRGWQAFASGQVTAGAYALQLAKEWASMPVLSTVQGASRQVTRGQSYYAGDGVNKAQVSADELEAILKKVRAPASTGPDAFPAKGAQNNEVVAQVQRRLKELGYFEVGNVDGDFGEATENAILIFQKDNGIPKTGQIDSQLLVSLAKAQPRAVSPKRENAAPKDVHDKAPEAKANWVTKITGFWGMITAGAAGFAKWALDNVQDIKAKAQPALDLFGIIPWWGYVGVFGAVAGFLYFNGRKGEKASVEAYRVGERR